MKKLLTSIAVSLLTFNIIPNINPCYNTTLNNFLSNSINPMYPSEINSPINSVNAMFAGSDGKVYVGTGGGELFNSLDGINFNKISNLDGHIVSAIFTSAQTNITWVATNQFIGGSTLFKTTDDKNFAKATDFFSDKQITAINEYNGMLYVGTYFGLYKSSDGSNFSKVDNVQNVYAICISLDERYMYVGSFFGLYQGNKAGEFKITANINDIVVAMALDSYGNLYFALLDGIYQLNSLGVKKRVALVATGQVQSIIVFYDKVYFAVSQPNNCTIYRLNEENSYISIFQTAKSIKNITMSSEGVIYLADYLDKFWAFNPVYKLVDWHNVYFDYNYNCLVTDYEGVLDIKDQLLASATLDGKLLSIPSKHENLSVGMHSLVLTLKDEYQTLAEWFGGIKGNKTLSYNFIVRGEINQNDIFYQALSINSEMLPEITSLSGNTKNQKIVRVQDKPGTSPHKNQVMITIHDAFIDYTKSYYVAGTADNNNNFMATGPQQTVNKGTQYLMNNGLYHLHLVNTYGNSYDRYIELGKDNFKLTGL